MIHVYEFCVVLRSIIELLNIKKYKPALQTVKQMLISKQSIVHGIEKKAILKIYFKCISDKRKYLFIKQGNITNSLIYDILLVKPIFFKRK